MNAVWISVVVLVLFFTACIVFPVVGILSGIIATGSLVVRKKW